MGFGGGGDPIGGEPRPLTRVGHVLGGIGDEEAECVTVLGDFDCVQQQRWTGPHG
jgi:hypothetical protein